MSELFPWPRGCRAAVSLSYDDGLPVHREDTAPQLEALGLRATFYAQINSDLLDHRDAWVRMAEAGHELGNHTIFHPCRDAHKRSGWPSYRSLNDYTPERWEDEVHIASRILRTYDGRSRRTFGNTCCDTTIGPDEAPISLDDLLAKHFVAARGPVSSQVIDPRRASLMQLGCYSADRKSFEELRAILDETVEAGGWVIFMAHGIGRDHNLQWDVESHRRTLEYLAAQAGRIWAAPVVDVASHVAERRMTPTSPA